MSGFWYMGAVTLCMMAGGSAVVLNKCCDDGSGMGENGTCVPQEVPPLVLPQVFAAPGVVAPSPPPPQFVHHRPPCSFLVLLSDEIDGPLYLFEDGRLGVTAHSVTFDTSQYCIVNSGGVAGFLACPDSEDIGDPEIEKAMIYPVGMVASLLLLVITFFVYSMLPELRNLQGKTTLCLVGCLSWTYLSLVIVQLGTNSLSLTACSVFGM
ncbi:hypothetical protein AAG570_010413 [Ranatra chinensis]|uniref:Uncharacterized protein n=1 Tax=Ranatra chinensis TaxID=642074 RepID=A0ABD0Z8K5_9HEMI